VTETTPAQVTATALVATVRQRRRALKAALRKPLQPPPEAGSHGDGGHVGTVGRRWGPSGRSARGGAGGARGGAGQCQRERGGGGAVGIGGHDGAATRAAWLPQRRWLSQREVAAAAVAATGTCTCRLRGSTVTKVKHGNSSGQLAQSRQRDADVVPQAPQPPGCGASEPAFSARDAQFFGNCRRTWWEMSTIFYPWWGVPSRGCH